jgi:hypothetical protein
VPYNFNIPMITLGPAPTYRICFALIGASWSPLCRTFWTYFGLL